MKPRPSPCRPAAGQLRIIGGSHRRSVLPVLPTPQLRPTPARVRETLFNWLGQDLDGWRCWDAFAGSGALGFEAASRGAREVVLVEHDAQLLRSLRQTGLRLNLSAVAVQAGDALVRLAQARDQGWDLVFVDPPFAHPEWVAAALQAAHAATHDQGLCYLESDRPWSAQDLANWGWAVAKSARAASVHYWLLNKQGTAP